MAKDLKLLSADTSSARLSIALLRGEKVIDEFQGEAMNMHSSNLIPEIDRILIKNSYTIDDIDAFCVGLGPGSFTGLRVGVTTMKGFALAMKKPIIGIPSIDTLAYNISDHKDNLCAIIDAKQQRVYARLYTSSGNAIKPKGPILLLNITELLARVKGHTIFLGDALRLYKADIVKGFGLLADFAQESIWYPMAQTIGKLALDRIKRRRYDNLFSLSPIYVYPKECQIKNQNSSQIK